MAIASSNKNNNVNKDIVEAVLSEQYPEFDRKRLSELVKRCKSRCYQSTLDTVENQIKDLLRPTEEAITNKTLMSVFVGWNRDW